jgi:predicted DNA-binding ribbon-helix-helix protein
MENIIQMQKEFEELISELKKLKKINQLTSENVDNSSMLISEMEEFVNIQKKFWESITEDYKAKKVSFEEGIEALSESTENTNNFIKNQIDVFKILFKDGEQLMNNEVKGLNSSIQALFNKYIEQLDHVVEFLKERNDQFTKVTHKKIDRNQEILLETLNGKIEETRSEISLLKKEVELDNKQFSNKLDSEGRNTRLRFQSISEDLTSKQNNGFSTLEQTIKETKDELTSRLENQFEKVLNNIKINRGVLIVSLLLNLVILLLLLLK